MRKNQRSASYGKTKYKQEMFDLMKKLRQQGCSITLICKVADIKNPTFYLIEQGDYTIEGYLEQVHAQAARYKASREKVKTPVVKAEDFTPVPVSKEEFPVAVQITYEDIFLKLIAIDKKLDSLLASRNKLFNPDEVNKPFWAKK